MKKRNIIITAVIILTIALIFAVTSCVPSRSTEEEIITSVDTIPTEAQFAGTEPTVQETAAPIEAVTESVENDPEVAQPVTTFKPNNSMNASNSSNDGSTGNGNSNDSSGQTDSATITVAPAPTEAPAEPKVSEPPVTEPDPTEHTHSWQEVCHEEVGHDGDVYKMCTCGFRFQGFDEWSSHQSAFSAADILLYHGSWSTGKDYIVDTPAYSTWVCACGATSDTQP